MMLVRLWHFWQNLSGSHRDWGLENAEDPFITGIRIIDAGLVG